MRIFTEKRGECIEEYSVQTPDLFFPNCTIYVDAPFPRFLVLLQPYMAPELLRSDDADLKYGKKVDVWAAGVVTHELLACVTPFRSVGNLFAVALCSCQLNGRYTWTSFPAPTPMVSPIGSIYYPYDSPTNRPKLTRGRAPLLARFVGCVW